jgi:hypothetical protein
MKKQNIVGKLIMDNGEMGIIVNKISHASWTDDPYMNFQVSYEIKYINGTRCVISEPSLIQMISSGRIYFIEGES